MLSILYHMMIRIRLIFDEMCFPSRLNVRWIHFLGFLVYFKVMNFQKCNSRNPDRAFLSQILFMCFLLVDEIFRFNILAWVTCFVVIAFDSLLVIIKHSLLVIHDHSKTEEYLEYSNLLVLFDCYCFCCYSEMITFMD